MPVRRDAEGVEEEPQRLVRFHGRARVRTAQVDVQLAVGETLGHLAPEADGQRGLAHPGRPGDDRDRHRLVRPGGPGRRQHGVQRAELVVAAGEALGVQRQLRRDGDAGGPGGPRWRSWPRDIRGAAPGPSPGPTPAGAAGPLRALEPRRAGCSARGRGGGQVQRGIAGQYLLVNAGQLGAGIDAEFLGEHPPSVLEHPQRLGVPPAAVQRDHQQPAHALAQRMVGHQRGQVGHDLLVAAQREQDFGPFLGGAGAQFGQPHPLGLRRTGPAPRRTRRRATARARSPARRPRRPGHRSCAAAGPGPVAARRRRRRAGPAPGAGRIRPRRRPAPGPARGPTWSGSMMRRSPAT